MKERLTTLALALGALAFFYAFFFPKPTPEQDEDLPLSTEVREHGYQALWRWLKAERIPVQALHEPYSELERMSSAGGSILITTAPHRIPARRDELEALERWVSHGNTLLVMAALDDTPPWSLGAAQSSLHSLRTMTKLDFLVTDQGEGEDETAHRPRGQDARGKRMLRAVQSAIKPEKVLMTARGHQPLFDGVRSVVSLSEFPASHWKAAPIDAAPVLEIGERPHAPDSGVEEPAFWLKSQGNGQVLVAGFSSLFNNALIGQNDNARLFANIIAWSRSPQGLVIFDDDHQGAVDYYDAKAFFHDSRLHRTLLWVVVLWLLFVLGWQGMRPAVDTWRPIDVTAFIGTTGRFFASSLEPAVVANRLLQNFFDRVRRMLGLPQDGTPVWEWLEQDARTQGSELMQLRDLYAKTLAGKAVDLVRLQNLLSRTLGNLE